MSDLAVFCCFSLVDLPLASDVRHDSDGKQSLSECSPIGM